MRVKEIMSSPSGKTRITVNQNENIDNAALLMKSNNLKQISVIDDNNKLVGSVTRQDILENWDELNEDFFLD